MTLNNMSAFRKISNGKSTSASNGNHDKENLFKKISDAKILLVGSGGIGCELLKNLSLCGFKHVEVIDLDTIDVSNLNRQFLFRSHHVGQSKCAVATEAAIRISPYDKNDINYKYFHGNVKNEQFDINFFKSFDVVLNALDNVDARRHVNRLCLAASVPLVEAGTTGYLGQTTVIMKDVTECYECQPKATQKVYPICTIRSTPSQPVHCIVWAKELFTLMFYHGQPKDKSMLYEDAEAVGGDSTYMDIIVTNRPQTKIPNEADVLKDFARNAIEALFITEINKQIDMKKYKGSKNAPKPLDLNLIKKGCDRTCSRAPSIDKATNRSNYDSTVWSVENCVAQMLSSIESMYGTEDGCQAMREAKVEFDKDDAVAMDFVTAAANLRAYVFGIDPSTLHDAKGIAGNIIPAIATTNAIVAGLQILEVFKILQHGPDSIASVCNYIYVLRDKTRKGFYLQPTKLPEPNPDCFVCRKSSINLSINTDTWTLKDLRDKVIKKALSFNAPTIMMGDSSIYEEGEGADESFLQNLPKMLSKLPCGGLKVSYLYSKLMNSLYNSLIIYL